MNIRHYYDKYRTGEAFSNKELVEAISKFTVLEASLYNLGDRYFFAYREIREIVDGLRRFDKERKEEN